MASIRFAHTNLIAREWARLASFYEQVLGCMPVPPARDLCGEDIDRLADIDHVRIRGIHLALPGYASGGPTLEVFQYRPEGQGGRRALNDPGLGHLAFQVESVEETLARVLAAGGSTVGDLVSIEVADAGTVKVVYARDIEGNVIEIQQWSD